MVSTAVKILVPLIVIVGGFFVIAVASTDISDGDCTYDYQVGITESFTASDGSRETSSSGNVFCIVTVYAVNNSVGGDGVSLNPLTWEWKLKTDTGLQFKVCWKDMKHPMYPGVARIVEGGSTTFTRVFEIPAEYTLDRLTIGFDYDSWQNINFIHDDKLL